MRSALELLAYAAGVAWCLPAPLARLTSRGASPRLGLTAWLAAMASVMASVLFSLGAALALLFSVVVAHWPDLTYVVCSEVAGDACTPDIYGSALYELGLAGLLGAASLAALAVAWRYGRRVRKGRRQTAAHAAAARIVGRELAGPGTVVLDDPRPAAYCAAGRPPVIVVTRGALGVLDDAQLAAVLAHEQAHLAGRHHTLVLAVRAMAAALPGIPLFDAGAAAVALLAEMCADDAAARSAGRPALAAALITIAAAAPGRARSYSQPVH